MRWRTSCPEILEWPKERVVGRWTKDNDCEMLSKRGGQLIWMMLEEISGCCCLFSLFFFFCFWRCCPFFRMRCWND